MLRLVDEILRGGVEEIVVSHKDRLCRFAFELFQWVCDQNNTSLVVQDQDIRSAEQELSEDLMAIVHVFSCRHHGMRRYGQVKRKRSPGEVQENTPLPYPNPGEDSQKVDVGRTDNRQQYTTAVLLKMERPSQILRLKSWK
jgi:hypothetical protein